MLHGDFICMYVYEHSQLHVNKGKVNNTVYDRYFIMFLESSQISVAYSKVAAILQTVTDSIQHHIFLNVVSLTKPQWIDKYHNTIRDCKPHANDKEYVGEAKYLYNW